jgi:hypothetical protein
MALFIASSCPATQPPAVSDAALPPWPEIAAALEGSDNDHTIKFVYTGREAAQRYGEPAYRRLAARQAGLSSQ